MKLSMLSLALAPALLAGCATAVDLRSVGTGGGPAAFELRGTSLAELDVQAKQLCPHGHQVFAEWQRQQAGNGEDSNSFQHGWIKASQWTGTLAEDEAQMTIQCNAAALTPALSR